MSKKQWRRGRKGKRAKDRRMIIETKSEQIQEKKNKEKDKL